MQRKSLPRSEHAARGILALILLSISYASFGVLSRLVSSDLLVFQQLTARIFIGAVVTSIFFRRSISQSKLRELSTTDWQLLVGRCVAGYIVGGGAFVAAVSMTSISNVAFLCAFPFEVLLAPLLIGEKVSRQVMFAFLWCVLGAFLVAVQGMSLVFGTGEILALTSALGMALYYILRRRHSAAISDATLTPLTLWIGTALLGAAALLFEGLPQAISTQSIWLTLFLGLLNGINVFLASYAFIHVAAAIAGNLLMLEIPFSILFGFVVFGEVPALIAVGGGLLVVGGAFLSHREMKGDIQVVDR